ncbi:MAG: HupE/UreJ family protein [Gammaproteobacteria bacterium]|nr:HupE/UreJ family protein [Gammaproteobacteria bacterium]
MSRFIAVFLCFFAMLPPLAQAHKLSDSYLTLNDGNSGPALRWDIALRDLHEVMSLDTDGDRQVTWQEVLDSQQSIQTIAAGGLLISRAGVDCQLSEPSLNFTRHSDGGYAVLDYQVHCPAGDEPLHIDYRLFADAIPQHHGVLSDQREDFDGTPQILSPEKPTLVLSPDSKPAVFLPFFWQGIVHIAIGLDHIVFVLTLLVAATVSRPFREKSRSKGRVLKEVMILLTAFTVAHSITLALSVSGLVALPSRWVESAIAATVAIVALNNLWPIFPERYRVGLTFVFGLIHGFGFAGVMRALPITQGELALSLAGFNIGVELGQIALVILALPLLLWGRIPLALRRTAGLGGSAAAVVIGTVLFTERIVGAA